MRGNRSTTGVLVFLAALASVPAAAQTVQVAATVETDPVPSGGDAADDIAIWIHPTDPDLSRIIGTDKQHGLVVYDLAGNELQVIPDGRLNNVDVRYNFPLAGEPIDIVAAGNRTDNTVVVYKADPVSGELSAIAAGPISIGINEAYGFCLYRSPVTGDYYAFVNDKSGNLEQWRLFDNGEGLVDAALVRSFEVGSITEGMVADDVLGRLYVGEEDVAIWRYGAEPDAGSERTQVDVAGGGHLTADIEGLTMYYVGDGTGYLIASSQGSDEFVIYSRQGANDYVTTFEITAGASIDGVSETDGIDVTNFGLGPLFPEGVFVVQDDSNPGGNQNFKLVPWAAIAGAAPQPLTIDTTWDPRAVGAFLSEDVNLDGVVDLLDLIELVPCFGHPAIPGCQAQDVNGDGTVNVLDLITLLLAFGMSSP